MSLRKRIIQIVVVVFVLLLTLSLLTAILPGLTITNYTSALVVGAAFILAQSLYWWLFVSFFAWLPVWLYPLLTFLVSGATIYLVGNFVEGVTIANIGTGIWISLALTAVSALLSGFLSIDMDEAFDRNVTAKLVKRRGDPIETDVPGFLFIEIDGLSEELFQRALEEGHMPTLKRWKDEGTHRTLGWETDFSAQTGAMQTGILLGSNDEIPAYRWWDREEGRLVASNDPRDAQAVEARLSNGRGLLSDGGASRGNMYSGDATESLMTFSTLLDSSRRSGPGFYFYLVSPYVIARLITRFFADVVREWFQAWQQKRRKDKFIVSSRTPLYAFFRAFLGPLLQDLVTYTAINDVLRGLPAIYALYAAYDDLAHFAGMQTPEAFEALEHTDQYFGRIERALKNAPRPYHIIVLSDHGQSEGPTFKNAYGLELKELVQGLVEGDQEIFTMLGADDAWGNLEAFLSESINDDTRTAAVVRTLFRSRTKDGVVEFEEKDKGEDANIAVLGSGCAGLIYFTDSKERMTYEAIQERHPELILGLVNHPGIGFILVSSEEQGDMVVGKGGIHFLDDGTIEEADPLEYYGPNAADHLRRESSFKNCPDLLVNARYDPDTGEMPGFENQVSHHGGLGGPQNHGFIFHPVELPEPEEALVGAPSVYRLLRGWRERLQEME